MNERAKYLSELARCLFKWSDEIYNVAKDLEELAWTENITKETEGNIRDIQKLLDSLSHPN